MAPIDTLRRELTSQAVIVTHPLLGHSHLGYCTPRVFTLSFTGGTCALGPEEMPEAVGLLSRTARDSIGSRVLTSAIYTIRQYLPG